MLPPLNTSFHCIFAVPDFKRSLAFYRDTLGFRAVWEKRRFKLAPTSDYLFSGGLVKRDDGQVTGQVELIEFIKPKYKPAPKRGSTDLGFWAVVFQVADTDEIFQEWKSKGVIFEREPEKHQVNDRILNSALLQDIDGNRIEITQVIHD